MFAAISSTVIAGNEYILECSISEIPNLVVAPYLEWLQPGGSVLASGSGIALSSTLYPVKTSDAGQYTCRATITLDSVGVHVESLIATSVIVKSEYVFLSCT